MSDQGQELGRIEWHFALADFEMKLRRRHAAGLARAGDNLAALDLVAALDHELARMGVGGDVALVVTHQDHVAVTLDRASLEHLLLAQLGRANMSARCPLSG